MAVTESEPDDTVKSHLQHLLSIPPAQTVCLYQRVNRNYHRPFPVYQCNHKTRRTRRVEALTPWLAT